MMLNRRISLYLREALLNSVTLDLREQLASYFTMILIIIDDKITIT